MGIFWSCLLVGPGALAVQLEFEMLRLILYSTVAPVLVRKSFSPKCDPREGREGRGEGRGEGQRSQAPQEEKQHPKASFHALSAGSSHRQAWPVIATNHTALVGS